MVFLDLFVCVILCRETDWCDRPFILVVVILSVCSLNHVIISNIMDHGVSWSPCSPFTVQCSKHYVFHSFFFIPSSVQFDHSTLLDYSCASTVVCCIYRISRYIHFNFDWFTAHLSFKYLLFRKTANKK